MGKINAKIKEANELIERVKPATLDDLIKLVLDSKILKDYGVSFEIVRYFGYIQGVRVNVTGRTKKHYLPSRDKVYSVFDGLTKYIEAGW